MAARKNANCKCSIAFHYGQNRPVGMAARKNANCNDTSPEELPPERYKNASCKWNDGCSRVKECELKEIRRSLAQEKVEKNMAREFVTTEDEYVVRRDDHDVVCVDRLGDYESMQWGHKRRNRWVVWKNFVRAFEALDRLVEAKIMVVRYPDKIYHRGNRVWVNCGHLEFLLRDRPLEECSTGSLVRTIRLDLNCMIENLGIAWYDSGCHTVPKDVAWRYSEEQLYNMAMANPSAGLSLEEERRIDADLAASEERIKDYWRNRSRDFPDID